MSWDDFRRATPSGPSTLKIVILGVVAALFVIVLPVMLWAAGVFTSGIHGKGEAVKQKNDASNWTQAQAGFERDWSSIKKLDRQTEQAKGDLDDFNKIHPASATAQPVPGDPIEEQRSQLFDDYKGARQQCENAVADYNASARTYTLRDFRSDDLPQQIDDQDPATDCR